MGGGIAGQGSAGVWRGRSRATDGSSAAKLHERLRARRPELEQAVLTRVHAISDPAEVGDRAYSHGLREAIPVAIDYALEAIQGSERNLPQIPSVLLVQARVAASLGVHLDTVLRRYFAGNVLFGALLLEEAQDIPAEDLTRVLRLQALLFDRLIAAISEEHRRDEQRPNTGAKRRLGLVKGLLAGEPLDASALAYDFEATHLAVVAKGSQLERAFKELASLLDRRLLIVCPEARETWVWLGGREMPDRQELDRVLRSTVSSVTPVALGEPASGIEGWRRTHRQAQAALPIALKRQGRFVHYGEVSLLASALGDELLRDSLREAYLRPIAEEPDGGELTREALRAYFASGRNISSAAAASGLNRNTIAKRIRGFEEATGHPLAECAARCEVALALEELGVV